MFFNKMKFFLNSWIGSVFFVIVIISFIAQPFLIPSGSMQTSLLIGDFLFAKKFNYGISIPKLPIPLSGISVPLMPDIYSNGHLISGEGPTREDIVVFSYPKNEKIYYVKRCVAVGNDEIIYIDKKLFIHFNEGDKYIKSNYSKSKIVSMLDKLWVVNPYIDKYPGIGYRQNREFSTFQVLLEYISHNKEINMRPIYIKDVDTPIYNIKGNVINALYTKVPKGQYYMVGDNRENSNDSRFWGSVPYKFIVGKPWFILFSIETRSYKEVLNGDSNGGGKDFFSLKDVCEDISIQSESCKTLWNKQRFSIRWRRVLTSVDFLEKNSKSLKR